MESSQAAVKCDLQSQLTAAAVITHRQSIIVRLSLVGTP